MAWGAASADAGTLAQAKAQGPYLLGFNEPDMAAQSNMTVDQALCLWPKLMDAGRVLGSPAVAYAWFGLPAFDSEPSSGLLRSGPVATEAGRAFEAAR
jgi:hypothetical protein